MFYSHLFERMTINNRYKLYSGIFPGYSVSFTQYNISQIGRGYCFHPLFVSYYPPHTVHSRSWSNI